jgi:FG-GAP repeat
MRRLWLSTLSSLSALSLSALSQAGAPYTLGLPVQPAGLPTNAFLGAALAVSDTGLGLSGGFVSPNVYPFVIAPATGALSFLPPIASPSSNDLFGSSLAIATPLSTGSLALVGAFGDDAGGANLNANLGKVYAYRVQADQSFAPAGVLISPAPRDLGNFGYSVAIQGNFAFIGEVKGRNANNDVVGSVHIFENTGGSTWELRSSLFGSQLDGVNGRRFGHSVAVSGNTLAIGAPSESDGGLTTNGAVYAYTGSGASWSLQQRILATDRASDDELGANVAIENEVIVAGSSRDDKIVGADAGSAYVFTRAGGVWNETAKLTSSNAQLRNLFGQSVAINNDEIAVGGYCETNGGCPGSGNVEVYRRNGAGAWVSVQSIVGSSTPNSAGFGYAAKFVPGNKALVISSFRTAPTNSGALYGALGEGIFANGFE